MSKNQNEELLSPETLAKLKVYEEYNEKLQDIMAAFFDNNANEVEQIESARECRNEVLDDLKQSLRADALRMDITDEKQRRVVINGFKIQKKWSSWYVVEQFVAIAQAAGMYDSAVAEGVIKVITQVDGKLAPEWLRKNSLEGQFEAAEDGKELTPSISGPKDVMPLGAEIK